MVFIVGDLMSVCVCGGVRYVPDTDDEVYAKEQSEDSDASDDSGTSTGKDEKSAVAPASQTCELSNTDDKTDKDFHAAATGNFNRCKDRVSVDGSQVRRLDDDDDDGKQQQLTETDVLDKKRRKLDDSASESKSSISSQGM